MPSRSELLAAISVLKKRGDHTTWNGQLPQAREVFQKITLLDWDENISDEEDFIWFRDQLDLAEIEHCKLLFADAEDEPASEPVSLAEPEPGLIDTAEAERMLALLGVGPDDPVILCAWGAANLYTPARKGKTFDWPSISRVRDWKTVENNLRKRHFPNFGFISCPGGARVNHTDELPGEIYEVQNLVYEIDDMESTDEQFGLWAKAGLPEPTCVLDTGNKSLHVWYRLKAAVSIEQGRTGRKRLSAAIEKILDGKTTDGTMHSPHQPARLAGGIHPKSGQRSFLVGTHGATYDFEELMALCPEVLEETTGQGYGELFREDDDEIEKGEQFPELPLGEPVPLTIALSKKTQQLINEGLRAGSHVGRPVTAFRLSKTLQCAEEQLKSLGQTFTMSARELFDSFVVNSDLYGGDVDAAFNKHWEADDIGCGEFSRLALLRAIRTAPRHRGWSETWSFNFSNKKGTEWLDSLPENFFWVTSLRTPERIVEDALSAKSEQTGKKLTSHQGRFLRYEPGQGYFKHLPTNTLKREIAQQLLPKLFSQNATGKKFKKHTTESKATACVKWLNTVLFEDRMDVVPAIAFTNGTFLLKGNELVEHSPQYRLTWSIQGDYSPEVDCPPEFRKFVCRSFGEEWLPVIQMVLRYLVDPTFKPSRLVMVIGPSGSGKGTFERLVEAMFPPSCISVITSGFAEINNPDKIHQFVRGKRLVTFPDLQGRQLGVGTIYSMTDGGLLTSRKLHESDADEGEAFNGRVLICSTQPPSMEDAGTGMTRRMLVLKTLPPTGKADLDLDDKLKKELGDIVSWALRAERSDVHELLTSGDSGGLLAEAGLAAEVQMDPIRSFIDICVEPSSAETITSDSQLFTAFKLFCHDQRHRATTQRNFVNRLKAALPHLRLERRNVPGSSGQKKTPAVFYGLQVRKGLMSKFSEVGDGDHVTLRDEIYSLDRNAYGEGGLKATKQHFPNAPTAEVVSTILEG